MQYKTNYCMALVVNPNRKYMFLLGMKTQNVVPMIMKLNHVTLSRKMDELALVKLLHDYTTKKFSVEVTRNAFIAHAYIRLQHERM